MKYIFHILHSQQKKIWPLCSYVDAWWRKPVVFIFTLMHAWMALTIQSFHFTNPFIVMWHVAIVILPLFPFWFKMSSVVCSTKRMKWSLLVHIFIFEEKRTVALEAKDNFRRNFCTCYRTGEECCKMFMTKPYIYYYGDIYVHSDQMFTVGNITEDYGRTWWTNGHW